MSGMMRTGPGGGADEDLEEASKIEDAPAAVAGRETGFNAKRGAWLRKIGTNSKIFT